MQEVQIESKPDGRKWICVCKRWLAKDEDDRKIERELAAVELNNSIINTNTHSQNYHFADEIIEHALPDYHKETNLNDNYHNYHDYTYVSGGNLQEQIINASGTPLPIKETATCTVRINGQNITGIWVNRDECMNWRGPIPIERYRINTDADTTIIKKVSLD